MDTYTSLRQTVFCEVEHPTGGPESLLGGVRKYAELPSSFTFFISPVVLPATGSILPSPTAGGALWGSHTAVAPPLSLLALW